MSFTCIVIGNGSLVIHCADMLLARGHAIAALVSGNTEVRAWAEARGLRVEIPGTDLADRLGPLKVDWLFSIANLAIVPDAVLAKATRGAINFHDGPLPRYAGLNAPVWALINRETRHGVTWHLIKNGIDEGDIVEQRLFDLDDGETALTLNTKCYGAAIDSFSVLVAALETGCPAPVPQALDQRTYFGRWARPAAAARLDFGQEPEALVALVCALDFGHYWNPLARPKIETGGQLLLVGEARVASNPERSAPGTVLAVADDRLVVAAGSGAIALGRLTDMAGDPLPPTAIPLPGTVLPSLAAEAAEALTAAMAGLAPAEAHWRRRLADAAPARLPQAAPAAGPADLVHIPLELPAGLSGDRLPRPRA